MEIRAEQTGMVICLRAVAAVKKGDSLATVLELPDE
jgi:predicted deacylase